MFVDMVAEGTALTASLPPLFAAIFIASCICEHLGPVVLDVSAKEAMMGSGPAQQHPRFHAL